MKNSLFLKIAFYTLLVAVAVSAGMLIEKNFSKTADEVKPPQDTQSEVSPQLISNPTCIITIDEKKYDVQPLRSTHPGGDIYKCDTDMSAIFHGKHGESVKRVEKYLIP